MRSKYLSNSALKSINRIGDILCPGEGEFPSYSNLGCVEHIDTMFENAPPADVKDLGLLLFVLAFMPTSVLNWLVKRMANSHGEEGEISVLLRQLDFGMRGIIFGTYYSGKVGSSYKGSNPLDLIGYDINRITD